MRTSRVLIGLAMIYVSLSAIAADSVNLTPCLQQNWLQCGISLGSYVFKLHMWSDGISYKVGGYECTARYKGRISSWQWKWDGSFTCPQLSPTYTAESKGWKSREGAVEHAMQEYFKTATSKSMIQQAHISQIVVTTTTTTTAPIINRRPLPNNNVGNNRGVGSHQMLP